MSDSANQNKKPVWAITGLAIVAAAVIAFLTRGQWSPQEPVKVATEQQVPAAASSDTKTAEQPAPAASTTTTTTAATEQPAAPAASTTAEQPAAPAATAAAEQPAAPAATTAAEQPAASTGQQTAAAEQPAATAEQPAAQAAATTQQQTATTTQTDQTQQKTAQAPAATTEQQQASAPAAEQPAATAPSTSTTTTAEAPAKTDAVVPAFDTVRVEKTGEAVIAGTAAAGSEVVIKFDGNEIGKTTANEDGAFVVVPDNPLPSGSGEITIEAKGKGDRNAVASNQTVAVIVPAAEAKQQALVAVVSPDQPTKVLQKPEAPAETQTAAAQPNDTASDSSTTVAKTPAPAAAKPVSIDAVDYDGAGNIVFSGDGTPGQTARIYVDNSFLADAPIGPDGHWSFSGTADVKTGVHQLRVDAIDAAGKVANRVEVPFFREDQTKIASAAQQPSGQTVAKTTAGTTAAGTTAEQGASSTAPATTTNTETSQSGQQTAAATATGEAAQPQAPREGRVVIQPGNNLWRISRVLYGNGTKYTMLYKANKDQIRNPNRIYPGQVFKTPDVAPKMETIDPKRREPLKPEENAATQN